MFALTCIHRAGVRILLTCLLRSGKKDGLLTPIPQYPLYSASLTLLGGELVPYHLNEGASWGVEVMLLPLRPNIMNEEYDITSQETLAASSDQPLPQRVIIFISMLIVLPNQMDNLRETLAAARADGTEVRGIAVINPGNPTGNILAEEQIKDIIQVNTENGYGDAARLMFWHRVRRMSSQIFHGDTPFCPIIFLHVCRWRLTKKWWSWPTRCTRPTSGRRALRSRRSRRYARCCECLVLFPALWRQTRLARKVHLRSDIASHLGPTACSCFPLEAWIVQR